MNKEQAFNQISPIAHDNVSEVVVQRLKEYIINNNLSTGDKLPSEPQLAEVLQISRSSIREAMKTLEGYGIIETKHGKGRFIRDFNYDQMIDNLSYNLKVHYKDFKEVAEVRIALETSFLPLAAEKYSDDDYKELEAILDKLESEINVNTRDEDLVLTHTQFHQRLYKNLDNRLLDSLISMFSTFQRILTVLNRYSTSDNEEFLKKHRELLDAVKTKDKAKILQAFEDHFSDLIK